MFFNVVCISWTIKCWMNVCVHKNPLLVQVLTQPNKVYAIFSRFFKINFNIISSSMPRSSNMPLQCAVSTKNVYKYFYLHSNLYIPPPPRHTVLDLGSCKRSVDFSGSCEHSILCSGFSEQNIEFSGSIKGEEFLNEARQVSGSTKHSVLWSYLCHNSACTVKDVLSYLWRIV
jgi:hypothetical protein